MVVTATRTPMRLEDVPGSVSVFDARDIESGRVADWGDLGRYEPGLSAARAVGGGGPGRNNRSGFQSITIRGLDGNRNLLLVDGVRAPEEFTFGGTNTIGRDYYDLSGFQRVEVVKGAGSSLYGSDAIGGVVGFRTLEPEDLLARFGKNGYAGSVTAYDSADNSWSQTARGAFRSGPVEMLGLYTHRQGEELDTQRSGIADPLDYESHYWLGKLNVQAAAEHRVKVAGEFFLRDTVTDQQSSQGALLSTFGPAIVSVRTDDDVQRWRASVGHEFANADADSWLATLESSLYIQFSETLDSNDQLVRSVFGPPNLRLRERSGEYTHHLVGALVQGTTEAESGPVAHRLAYGVDLSRAASERLRNGVQTTLSTGAKTNVISPDVFPLKDIPDTEIWRAGVFLQDEMTMGENGWFSLTPGLRFDSYVLRTRDDPLYLRASGGVPSVDYEDFGVSPRLGMKAQLSREWSVYAQFSQGFRGPTPEDLNGTITNATFFYQTLPNPDLESETSYGVEWGARLEHEAIRFHPAIFYNYYQNFIETFATVGGTGVVGDPLIFQSVNLDEAEIYGVEAEVELPLGFWFPRLEGLSVVSSAAHAIGNNLQDNVPLNSVDPFKWVNTLRYRDPGERWGADLAWTLVEAKHRVDRGPLRNQFIPGGYQTLDLTGYWQCARHTRLGLGFYNLTDAGYFVWQDVRGLVAGRNDVDRFTQPGTSVRASLTLEF